MIILAIETSCDETSAAVLKSTRGHLELLANVVSSQIDIHKQYGGVVPEVAARMHVKNILPVVMEALATAKVKPEQIDLIASTAGPGLSTSLIIGLETAKTLSLAWKKPLLAVNHMYSHIAANFLKGQVKFPAACLVVSGGHTEIVHLKNYWQSKKLGQTVDDAAGEAFDKVAKLLGLGYPGGPIVSKMALNGDTEKYNFPRPMMSANNFDFSFSGLKTAVLYQSKKENLKWEPTVCDFCASFEQAVIDVLTNKTIKAAKKFKVKTVMMAGGVAANRKLRETLEDKAKEAGFEFMVPEFKLCTDNAAMVAIAAYYLSQKKKVKLDNYKKAVADPNWELV